MNEPDFTVKKLSLEHLEQYNDLLRYAFQLTDKLLQDHGWENDEIRQSKFPVLERATVFGSFDGDNLVSQVAVYPFEMNIYRKIYSIGIVTSVSTYPEYSGLGLMSRLLERSLVEMRSRGQSLALLNPYSIPLYRHKGWEIVSDKMSFRVRDTQLPQNIDVPGYVRRVSTDDSDLVRLHMQFARQTHGCLLRDELAWEEYWRWDVEDTTVAIYYGAAGQPLGYMVYSIKEDTMYIKEMIYLNTEAKRGLWRYVAAHESMIEQARGNNYYGEPVAFELEDSDIEETIRPYSMGRIVDVEMFMCQYPFLSTGAPLSLALHVSDPMLEWNNRTFTFEIESGKGQLSTHRAQCSASLSIGALTALLLGYKRASELARLDMLEADSETIRLLDGAIPYEKPYISDYV